MRWLHFATISVVFGGIGLRFIVLSERTRWPVDGRNMIQLRFIAACASASGLAWLGCTIANVAGPAALVDGASLQVFFLQTPFGLPAAVRAVLLVLVAAAAALPLAATIREATLFSLAAVLLVSQAWFGHAAEGGTYATAMIVAYAVHVLAAAAWAGSLPTLAGMLRLCFRESRESSDAAMLLRRYARLAGPAVVAVVGSGIANTTFHAGREISALIASDWGHVLLIKLILVSTMLILAFVNRVILTPRLRSRAGTPHVLSSTVQLEASLGLLVFGAAAVLGMTPPPH